MAFERLGKWARIAGLTALVAVSGLGLGGCGKENEIAEIQDYYRLDRRDISCEPSSNLNKRLAQIYQNALSCSQRYEYAKKESENGIIPATFNFTVNISSFPKMIATVYLAELGDNSNSLYYFYLSPDSYDKCQTTICLMPSFDFEGNEMGKNNVFVETRRIPIDKNQELRKRAQQLALDSIDYLEKLQSDKKPHYTGRNSPYWMPIKQEYNFPSNIKKYRKLEKIAEIELKIKQ